MLIPCVFVVLLAVPVENVQLWWEDLSFTGKKYTCKQALDAVKYVVETSIGVLYTIGQIVWRFLRKGVGGFGKGATFVFGWVEDLVDSAKRGRVTGWKIPRRFFKRRAPSSRWAWRLQT